MVTAGIVIACPNLSLDRTITVEGVAVGHVHRATRSDARGGGKGVNVARALRCVGVSSTVVGLAAGRTGDAVAALLADEGLEVVTVSCSGETRSCLTVLDRLEVTVFNEPGPELSAAEWDAYAGQVTRLLRPGSLLVCSGSFPPGAPVTGAAQLIDAARRAGCDTICDTSRAQLEHALTARPDVVSPNLAEALALLEDAEVEAEAVEAGEQALEEAALAARALVERGARATLVTAGRAGAALHAEGRTLRWTPPAVQLVNPVGAGDCLVAGLACGRAAGEDLAASARRGLAMAAASCETFPAGVLDRRRAEELVEWVVRVV